MTRQPHLPWYRETTMLIAAGILIASFASGAAMLFLAITNTDELVISEQDYQTLRDELRGTTAPPIADDD